MYPTITSEIEFRTKEDSDSDCLRHRKLIITTFNSIRDFNPMFYIKHIPKQMIEYTLTKLIDNNPKLFQEHGQYFNNPISSYIHFKLYKTEDNPLLG